MDNCINEQCKSYKTFYTHNCFGGTLHMRSCKDYKFLKEEQAPLSVPFNGVLYATLEYGTTKYGYVWHRIKNDGKALCNPKLNIDFRSSNPKAMICNGCQASSQLKRNQSKLQPMGTNGDGI